MYSPALRGAGITWDAAQLDALIQTIEDPAARAKFVEQLRTLEVAAVRELDAPAGDGTSLLEFCIDPGESAVQRIERRQEREQRERAEPDDSRHGSEEEPQLRFQPLL